MLIYIILNIYSTMSMQNQQIRLLEIGVNLKFTKKQCQDIVKMQILQLRADGESDIDIKEFFTRLLERKCGVALAGTRPEVIEKTTKTNELGSYSADSETEEIDD